MLWAFSSCAIKLSVLAFYMEIFQKKLFRRACYALITITVAYLVAVFLEPLLLCRPLAYFWDKTLTDGVCGSSLQAYLLIGIINMILDFLIVCLPMPILWRLQMPASKKVAVSGVISMGLLQVTLAAGSCVGMLMDIFIEFPSSQSFELLLSCKFPKPTSPGQP